MQPPLKNALSKRQTGEPAAGTALVLMKNETRQMRIYVTGGTGLVGCNVIRVAVERHGAHVFATIHRRQPTLPVAFDYGAVDTSDRDQVLRSVRAFRPEAIVHCAAILDLPLIYRDRELGWRSYVQSTRYLTEAANEIGAKMILISTDWVFDGTQAFADETTPPNPINYYGLLKVVAETCLAASGDNWAVARVAGVNGMHWARPELTLAQNVGLGNFAWAVISELQQDRAFTVWEGDVNMRGTPVLASEIGEMIIRIVELDKRGIFHCCGGESVGRLEFARAAAQVFELNADLIESGPWDASDAANWRGIPVPRDTSLSASYTEQQLAYPLLDVRSALEKLRWQVQTGKV